MTLAVKRKEDITNELVASMQAKDANAFSNSLQMYGENLVNELKAEMEANIDNRILTSRGINPLTSAEMKFAEGFTSMVKAKLTGAKMALSDTEVVMPETIIDKVFEDITVDHPLLGVIDFQNTSYQTKVQVSKLAMQEAVWGAFDAEVTKELDASFEEADMTLLSLTAFIPVSRGLLDLGPSWITSYVVTMLQEAIANGLEKGIITGLKEGEGPIGLMADLTTGSGSSGSVEYSEKTPVVVKDFKPETIGKILDYLSQTRNENVRRPVNEVVIAVNPADYFTKIYPAITVQGVNGNYVERALPGNVRFLQSAYVPKNKAIPIRPKGYWMGLGQSGTAGRIEYSDEYKFLERKRYFMTYLYANGFPKDNFSSMVLDITNLKPAAIVVEQVSAGE